MKAVYIAGPYKEGDQFLNVRNMILMAETLREIGTLPFVPLLDAFWNFLIPHSREYWLEMDLDWVARSDAVLRLPGESEGADMEVAEAERLGIPVFCSIDDLKEWLQE